jgi:hypothetical protein
MCVRVCIVCVFADDIMCVSVCVCACVRVRVCVYIHTHVYTYIHTYNVYIHTYIRVMTYAGDGGGTCASGTLGEKAIRTATQAASGGGRGGHYWYAPDASIKVLKLLCLCG